MIIYTIGFTQKSAEQFFKLIKANGVELLIDVRLNNSSQLAGFSKGSDLKYFLREICAAGYIHCREYAPTKELLSGYQKKTISWEEYTKQFDEILNSREACKRFPDRFSDFNKVCLLCSEPNADRCHRRLVAEKVQSYAKDEVEVIHI